MDGPVCQGSGNCDMLKERRAFTLIELLVVIAIIAVLVSLLMPSLKRAKELARQSICAAHLKQVGTALNMYIPDQEYWMPGYQWPGEGPDDPPYVDSRGYSFQAWMRTPLMTYYYGGTQPANAESLPPRNGDGFLGAYTPSSKGGIEGILGCPAVPWGPTSAVLHWRGTPVGPIEIWRARTFGLNVWGVTERNENRDFEEIQARRIDRPAEMTYMCEAWGGLFGMYPPPRNTEADSFASPAVRHFGEFQMVFCDGHIEHGPLNIWYRREFWLNPNLKN